MRAEGAAVVIRPVRAADAAPIAAIYNHHVTGTIVTFDETPLDAREMARLIRAATLPWFVVEHLGVLAGYARALPWKTRSAYRHTVESSVYVDPGFQRRGHGRRLYEALLAELRAREVHVVLAGIALPNSPSIALHESLGFAESGVLREVGWKLGRCVDVGYWTLVLSPGRVSPPNRA
jgi:phosphinothricin acetyltransferase